MHLLFFHNEAANRNDVFNVRSQTQSLQMQSHYHGAVPLKSIRLQVVSPRCGKDPESSGCPTSNLWVIRSGRQMSTP